MMFVPWQEEMGSQHWTMVIDRILKDLLSDVTQYPTPATVHNSSGSLGLREFPAKFIKALLKSCPTHLMGCEFGSPEQSDAHPHVSWKSICEIFVRFL